MAQGHTAAMEQGSDTCKPVSCTILCRAARDRDRVAGSQKGSPRGHFAEKKE